MDRGVIATATELFECRHFPSVVALCGDALEAEPECVALLVIRARAHIGLRRDLDAQADLRDIIRLDPQCGIAYRLLGELAARRSENESAAIFFREAIRLDSDDQEARDWLQIVDASVRPAVAARPLPAPAATAGRFHVQALRIPIERGPQTGARTLSSPARPADNAARFARGTRSPHDELPTKPFARGSERNGEMWKTPTPTPTPALQPTMMIPQTPPPLPPPPNQMPHRPGPLAMTARVTVPGRPSTQPPAPPTKFPQQRPVARSPLPELPGFGDYLVTAGIISRERLRAAQAYQRSMKVQLSTAIVTLGLATPQWIEWAAVSHQWNYWLESH